MATSTLQPPPFLRSAVGASPAPVAADWRRSAAARAVARAVAGDDVGVGSYTTATQADALADALALTPRSRLLDLGAGQGWPAIRIARRVGCAIVPADLDREELRESLAGAATHGVRDRLQPIVATGALLPFADASFDAVTHADVMC